MLQAESLCGASPAQEQTRGADGQRVTSLHAGAFSTVLWRAQTRLSVLPELTPANLATFWPWAC